MHHFFNFLAFGVAAWGYAASLPDLHVLRPAARGLATPSSSLGHGNVRDDLIHHLARRGTISCPEEIGGQPLSCASTLCGGEDPANADDCTTKHSAGGQCQCKPPISVHSHSWQH